METPESPLRSEATTPPRAEPLGDEPAPARQPAMYGLVSAAVVVAALYFGRDLLMPLALAMLLGFVLDPMVSWLQRRRVPRPAAVLAVVAGAVVAIAASGFFVFGQLRQIGNDLPTYGSNVTQKLRSFGDTLRQPGVFDQYSRLVDRVEREVGKIQQPAGTAVPRSGQPLKVQVVGEAPRPWQSLLAWGETVAAPLAILGSVLVFVVLILLDKGELRDKLLRLLGNNLHRSTDAMDDAAGRVSKYLTMQLIVNASYGIPMALGLLLIGVPGALVWGLLAAVLRFVPYVGPMISATFPLALAFAVDPGWSMVLWTLALIVTLELINNNVIEPWLYGSSTGMSTLALIVAAMFWTTLWGPIGLVLSTPMTVVLMVLGHHLPQLRVFEILLGSQRALDEPTRLHQRLLAGDVEEAVDMAMSVAEDQSPEQFYDQVGLDALRLAATAHDTVATAEHRHRVVSGMERVIDELREQYPVSPDLPVRVACIGGRWATDALAADMAAHVLGLHGMGARAMQAGVMSADYFSRLDLRGIEVVCLGYFSPDPITLARYFVRRLRRRWPHIRVILAAWDTRASLQLEATAGSIQADACVTTLSELITQCEQRLARAAEADCEPAAVPDNEAERQAALHTSGALAPALRGRLDELARRAADVFDCPTAQVALIDGDWRLTHGDAAVAGRPDTGAPEQDSPRAQSLCSHVVALAAPLVVPDVQRDRRFAGNSLLAERGVRFYAGAPLRNADGLVLGTLCLIDDAPRTLSPRDVVLLEKLAGEVMAAVREAQAAALAAAAEGAA